MMGSLHRSGDAYPSQVLYIICRYNNVDHVVLSFVLAVQIFFITNIDSMYF